MSRLLLAVKVTLLLLGSTGLVIGWAHLMVVHMVWGIIFGVLLVLVGAWFVAGVLLEDREKDRERALRLEQEEAEAAESYRRLIESLGRFDKWKAERLG